MALKGGGLAVGYMNFNRRLIWYASEVEAPLDRDQVDRHGEDNTRSVSDK